MEQERLEVRYRRASERPVNADPFRVAQKPDAPLARQDNDAPVVTDEYAVVCERRRHNNVLCSARMLSPHPDPPRKSVVGAFPSARQCLVADARDHCFRPNVLIPFVLYFFSQPLDVDEVLDRLRVVRVVVFTIPMRGYLAACVLCYCDRRVAPRVFDMNRILYLSLGRK